VPGESLDYANHQSSLNGFQTAWDGEGVGGQSNAREAGQSNVRQARYVIAHRDSGIANWLDTTGVPVGFMTFRWTYGAAPAEVPVVRSRRWRSPRWRDASVTLLRGSRRSSAAARSRCAGRTCSGGTGSIDPVDDDGTARRRLHFRSLRAGDDRCVQQLT
jgi:hypothetical protein